jgi:hypothetical protein
MNDLLQTHDAEPPEEVNPEPEISSDELQARNNGWLPQEEYDGDPDHWRSAQAYNERGEMIGSVRAAQKTAQEAQTRADKALERNNQFHKMQNDMQTRRIDDLERQLKETVAVGDTAGFERIQEQIKVEQSQVIPIPEPEAPPEVDVSEGSKLIEEWNAQNPWIAEHSPEASFAKAEFDRYLQQNNTPDKDPTILIKGAIAAVEHIMEKQFSETPAPNENRFRPSKFTRGKMGRKSTRALTMADLNRDEMGVWQAQSSAYKNEEEFLDVVANARRGIAQ